jgi:N-acetylmuramoyl-L-alanine amidase
MCSKIKNHNVNRLVSLLVFISLTSFTYTYAGGTGQGASVHTLVIDPGHGGMDPGAIGPGGHHESDLALAVSLKFGEMVKEAFPDVKIIYTRTTDKFVSLADRADMANKAKADLFICIHLNSALTHDAYGTATYVLGLHRTDDNLEVAKRENAVIELEGDKDKNYEFDPNSPEGHIIMSMKQNAFLDQSILIASKIEDELAQLSKRKSHGVKQAGFWVLYKTAMPSLLAEIGFISNATEEQYLATDVGQQNIALSIFKAFRSYKYEIEGIKDTNAMANQPTIQKKAEPPVSVTQAMAQNTNQANPSNPPKAVEQPKPVAPASDQQQPITQSSPSTAPDTVKPKPPVDYKPIDKVAAIIPDTQSIVQHGKVVMTPESTQPKIEKKPVPPKENDAASINAPDTVASVAIKEIPKESVKAKAEPPAPVAQKQPETVAVTPAKTEPKPVVKEPAKQVETTQVAPKETITKEQPKGKEEVYFTVQLLAAKHKPGNYEDLVNMFGLIDREDIGEGIIRYMAGEFATYSEAKKELELAHEKGIKDAFIVGYLNKKRLDGRGTFLLGQKYP